MSWSNTYTHTVVIGVDILTASIFWNTSNVTVSSLCGLELRRGYKHTPLALLGALLNKISKNHCELAIQADLGRQAKATLLLNSVPPRNAVPS